MDSINQIISTIRFPRRYFMASLGTRRAVTPVKSYIVYGVTALYFVTLRYCHKYNLQSALLVAYSVIMSRKKRSKSERKKRYEKYLQSEHWKQLRESVFVRDNRKCTKCKSSIVIQAHHLIYREPLESCTPNDLITLCKRCHRIEHGLFVASDFDVAKRAIDMQLNHCIIPPFSEIKKLASLMEHDGYEHEVAALIRLCAICRLKEKRWEFWLKNPRRPEIQKRLWQWSMMKLKQIKKELNYVW